MKDERQMQKCYRNMLLFFVALIVGILVLGAAATRNQLLRAYLAGPLDGNGSSITNLGTVSTTNLTVMGGTVSGVVSSVTNGDSSISTVSTSGVHYVRATNITEAKLTLADNTTANASTSAHGFLPKFSNLDADVLKGTGGWSGISNAQIAAAAAIARTKLASGTADHVLINDGSGVPSSEATLGATRFPALTGDVTTAGGSLATTIAANSVALTTDTTGNYVADVAGTANEITSTHTPGEGSTATLSLPVTIDLGGKTSFEIPNAAAPTVDAFGEIAGDNDLWAASRGAPIFYDGTAAVALIGALVSDTPSNGQVPKWNTGGTITWENDSTSASGDAITVNGVTATDLEITNTTTMIWGLDTATTPDTLTGFPTNLANAQISASAAIAKSKISSSGTWTAAEIPTLQTVADGGANTIKTKSYIVLASPFTCDGVGAAIVTNNNTLAYFGQALMSGTAATNANYVEYRITVPEDIDTAVDMKVERWKVRLSGADTAAHTYNIGMASVADSAGYDSPTLGQWVALSLSADASGASGDVETVSNVTLTDWKSNVTAGRLWVIRVNRDGAGDASTVAAYSGPLVISYGTTQ